MAIIPTAEDVAERLASAAESRRRGYERAKSEQALMTPEKAAEDEFNREELNYRLLGAIELFSTDAPRVPCAVIRASPERAEYIRRRAEEIRKERESKGFVDYTTEIAKLEAALGRPIAGAEREQLIAWLKASSAAVNEAATLLRQALAMLGP